MRLRTTAALWIVLLGSTASAQEPTGTSLFLTHCATCHGAEGEGGGPVASAMSIAVPNLRTIAMRNGGMFPADDVAAYIDGREQRAAHGSRTMPVWGDFLGVTEAKSADESVRTRIAALVSFIEKLQYR
jgi:mono/diheme cytochrome c family protein